jgi:hypothetical protein
LTGTNFPDQKGAKSTRRETTMLNTTLSPFYQEMIERENIRSFGVRSMARELTTVFNHYKADGECNMEESFVACSREWDAPVISRVWSALANEGLV